MYNHQHILQAIGYDNVSCQSRFTSLENLQWQYNAAAESLERQCSERQKSLSPVPPPNYYYNQSFQRFGLNRSFYENVKY